MVLQVGSSPSVRDTPDHIDRKMEEVRSTLDSIEDPLLRMEAEQKLKDAEAIVAEKRAEKKSIKVCRAKSSFAVCEAIGKSLGSPRFSHITYNLKKSLLVLTNGDIGESIYLWMSDNERAGIYDNDDLQVFPVAFECPYKVPITLDFRKDDDDDELEMATFMIAGCDKSQFTPIVSQLVKHVFPELPGLERLYLAGFRGGTGSDKFDDMYVGPKQISFLGKNPDLKMLTVENFKVDPLQQAELGQLTVALKFSKCFLDEGGCRLLSSAKRPLKLYIDQMMCFEWGYLADAVSKGHIATLKMDMTYAVDIPCSEKKYILKLLQSAAKQKLSVGWGEDATRDIQLFVDFKDESGKSLGTDGTRKFFEAEVEKSYREAKVEKVFSEAEEEKVYTSPEDTAEVTDDDTPTEGEKGFPEHTVEATDEDARAKVDVEANDRVSDAREELLLIETGRNYIIAEDGHRHSGQEVTITDVKYTKQDKNTKKDGLRFWYKFTVDGREEKSWRGPNGFTALPQKKG